MEFKETNLNPTGKKVGDCVIRAIMKATNQTWSQVYSDLCEIGAKKFLMPNSPKVYNEYLERLSWKKQPMPKRPNGIRSYKRYTVEEFANENPKKTFVISIANHLTVMSDGILYDTWNCKDKSLGNYWKK